MSAGLGQGLAAERPDEEAPPEEGGEGTAGLAHGRFPLATGGPKPTPVGAAYGRANTHNTEPPSGTPISGVSVARDFAWLEPLPVAIATYCLPSTE